MIDHIAQIITPISKEETLQIKLLEGAIHLVHICNKFMIINIKKDFRIRELALVVEVIIPG